MYFIFVQDRESEEWSCVGPTKHRMEKEYVGAGRRKKTVVRYDSWTHPKPENVSAFIKAHKIIKAETEEEAWILNSI